MALKELLTELNLSADETAYMGDDLPDLGAIKMSGLGISVPNGHDFVKANANCCSSVPGGAGAVREICDLILDAKGLLHDMLNHYLN